MRPEKVRLAAPDTPGLPPNQIEGRIVDGSFIGVSTQYLVSTAMGTDLTVVVQNMEGVRFAPGDSVVAAWLPEHTFLVGA